MLARTLPYGVPAFSGVWFTHVVLTRLGDPLGTGFDFALWITASVLHLAAFGGLFLTLARVHERAAGNRRTALTLFAVWCSAALALLLLAAATRAWWAPLLGTATGEYFSPTTPMRGGLAESFRQRWLGPWQSGLVVAAEALLLVVSSALHAFGAYLFGKHPYRSALASSLMVLLALALYTYWCPWFFFDYDMFHGDLVATALLFDQFALVAVDPYSTIGAACYLTAWGVCLAFLRLTPKPEPRLHP